MYRCSLLVAVRRLTEYQLRLFLEAAPPPDLCQLGPQVVAPLSRRIQEIRCEEFALVWRPLSILRVDFCTCLVMRLNIGAPVEAAVDACNRSPVQRRENPAERPGERAAGRPVLTAGGAPRNPST